jgi:hypothetical protein
MKVWTTLTPDELRDVARKVGVKIHSDWNGSGIRKDGRAWNFRLALDSDKPKRSAGYKYQRTSTSGFNPDRRVAAVCWHGHRDFMRAIFDRDPSARIKSAFADYKGRENFEREFPATAHRNVGSMMYPVFMIDACTCSWGDWNVDSGVGGTYAVTMRQGMIRECPHYILSPDHYNADGTCKCNDPHDANMQEWGYTWNETEGTWA